MRTATLVCLAALTAATSLTGCAYKGYNPRTDGEPGRRDKGGVAMINPVTKDGRVLGYDREGYYGTRSDYDSNRSDRVHDNSDRVHYDGDDCTVRDFDRR